MEVGLVTGTSLSLQEVHSIKVHSRSIRISHIAHTLYLPKSQLGSPALRRSSLSLHASPHRSSKLRSPLHIRSAIQFVELYHRGVLNSPRGAPQGARFPQRILLGGSNIARVFCAGVS